MNTHRKILILGLVVCLLLSFAAGCSKEDTSWIAQSGENTVPVGVYMVEMMMGYNDASSQLPGSDNILKETIGEVPVVQYISDFAKAECAKLLTVRKEFVERGLVLSADEQAQSTSYTDYLYSIGQDFYTANGVAKESVQYINDTTMMSLAIFNSLYGEGGEKEVPRSELEKEFANTYTRSLYIYFPKIDLYTGEPLGEEELAAVREKADGYLARAKAGEDFFGLFKEAMAELDPDSDWDNVQQSLYEVYLENNAGYFYPGYEGAVVAAADNEVRLVEQDDVYFLLKKLPLMKGDPDTVEQHLTNILQDMKYNEYNDELSQRSRDADVRYNNAALAAYTPSKLKMTQEALAAAAAENSSSQDGSEGGAVDDLPDQPASGTQPAEGPSFQG